MTDRVPTVSSSVVYEVDEEPGISQANVHSKLEILERFESFEMIADGESPPEDASWRFWPLFCLSQTGKMLIWEIGFDADESSLLTIRGFLDSSSFEDRPTLTSMVPYRRNIKTNTSGRSMAKQAHKEALKRFSDAKAEGYTTGRNEVKTTRLPAQLCAKYISPRHGKTNFRFFPGDISPKEDGIRAFFWLNNGEVEVLSRENKIIVFLYHLREQFLHLLEFLPNVGWDCELTSENPEKKGKVTFNSIQSMVMQKLKPHPRENTIIANVLDIVIENVCLEERLAMIAKAYDKYLDKYGPGNIRLIPHYPVKSHKEIDSYFSKFLSEGYEGAVLRKYKVANPSKPRESYYLGKRNNNMMKIKIFDEREATIQEVVLPEGEEGRALAALLKVEDDEGNVFIVRPRGTHAYRRWMYEHPDECIGRRYTIIHFGVSEYGVPRFPVGKGFRDIM